MVLFGRRINLALELSGLLAHSWIDEQFHHNCDVFHRCDWLLLCCDVADNEQLVLITLGTIVGLRDISQVFFDEFDEEYGRFRRTVMHRNS